MLTDEEREFGLGIQAEVWPQDAGQLVAARPAFTAADPLVAGSEFLEPAERRRQKKLASGTKPDLLITDLNMPGMNGI